MAPTSTFNFAGRDLDANDVASMFDQPTATPSPWIDPHIPEAFSLPKLLALIALCVVGTIMVFILWRWNSVYFSDFPADHKDLLTQWKLRHLKPSDTTTASTETLASQNWHRPRRPHLHTPLRPTTPPRVQRTRSSASPGRTLLKTSAAPCRPLRESGNGVRGGDRQVAGWALCGLYAGALQKQSSASFDSPLTIRKYMFSVPTHFPPMPLATVRHLLFEFRIQVLESKPGFLNQTSRIDNGKLVCFARGTELEHRNEDPSFLRPGGWRVVKHFLDHLR
ncbi:hypothetical protein C8R43DRAFT_961556 [Mycena crocata]|nr:hypothetical protein C8R43DRAFT_961556 [Mycena crocata]